MSKEFDNHTTYLVKLCFLNRIKKEDLITDKEYSQMKKFLMNKHNIQDLLWS